MGQILRMKLPTFKNEVHSYFVISDLHAQFLHLPSFKILCQHAKKVPFPALIINGDIFDLPFMMQKNPLFKRWIKRPDGIESFFIPEFQKECAIVNCILDTLLPLFEKIIFINGNHDSLRIESFLSSVPFEYHHHFNYREKLKLDDRKITVVEYGDWLDIGDVSIIHGLYHNKTCHKTHHEDCGKSVIFGHIHKAGMVPFKQRGKTHHVWSLPCMSTLNPEYTRKKTNDWDNGYGLLQVVKDGSFNFNLFTVWGDKLVLPSGEILYGDEKNSKELHVKGAKV